MQDGSVHAAHPHIALAQARDAEQAVAGVGLFGAPHRAFHLPQRALVADDPQVAGAALSQQSAEVYRRKARAYDLPAAAVVNFCKSVGEKNRKYFFNLCSIILC